MIRFLALLLWVPLWLPQADPASLVGKLRSEKIDEREAAGNRLVELGKAALAELHRAAKDPDPNVGPVARRLVWRITLGPALVKKVRERELDFDETAAWEADATWTAAFLEATKERKEEELPPFRPRELAMFFPNALRGAKDVEETDEVLAGASGFRVPGVEAELVKFLTHADAGLREHAITRLRHLGAREALPEILGRLEDPEPDVRGAAFSAVGAFRWTAATPRLLDLLRHQESQVRRSAAEALGRIGSREAAGPLVELLTDDTRSVRSAAAAALVQLRAYDRVPQLEVILNRKAGRGKREMLDALAGLEVPEAIPGLRAALKDPSRDRRIWAMNALERIGAPGLVEDLVGMMDDADPAVLHCAVQSLTGLKAREGHSKIARVLEGGLAYSTALMYVQALRPREAIPFFVKQLGIPAGQMEALQVLGQLKAVETVPAILLLLKSDQGGVPGAAVGALIDMEAPEAVPLFEGSLDDPNPHVRTSAISALAQLGSKASLPALRKRLEKGEEWDLPSLGAALLKLGDPAGLDVLRRVLKGKGNGEMSRQRAIWALAELKPPGVIEDMRRALQDADPQVRRAALGFLAEQRCKEAVPDVLPFLGTEEQFYAARLIVAVGAREVVPAVRKLLQHRDASVRRAMAGLLAELGARESIPDLLTLLKDPEAEAVALSALADLGAIEALPAIRKFLEHDRPELRIGAVVALGKLGVRESIPDLVGMLRDENGFVIQNAVESLVEMGARAAVPDLQRLQAAGFDLEIPLVKLGDRGPLALVRERVYTVHESFPLNAVRNPEAWARLEGRIFVRQPEDTVREALERMSRDAGLPLEWPPMSKEQTAALSTSQWHRFGRLHQAVIAGGTHARSSLLRALEQTSGDVWLAVVLENDRIRLLPVKSARRLWEEWWKVERAK